MGASDVATKVKLEAALERAQTTVIALEKENVRLQGRIALLEAMQASQGREQEWNNQIITNAVNKANELSGKYLEENDLLRKELRKLKEGQEEG